jgi:hypothetical protein
MTANLRTMTKEKRELLMKRHLIPATVLAAMKKVAFAILCASALMIVAAPAWADQCSSPSVGTGTGIVGFAIGSNTCGAVITVFAVDGSGNATAFTVSNPGGTNNGNPYDGTEDTLVGIQNNSGAALKSIHLSASDATFGGIFNFDGDGPCNTVYHSPAYSWCPVGYPTVSGDTNPVGYEGSNNTFTVDAPTSCGGEFCTFLASGTVNFVNFVGDANVGIPSGGSTWFALEGTPTSFGTISQTQTLHPGVQVIYPAGNDNIKFTPFNNVGGELLTVTAVPVPQSTFGTPIGFPNETCVPYKDFSDAAGVPTCVEFQAECAKGSASVNDCSTFLFQTVTNYDLPDNLPAIGGPDYLIFHAQSAPLATNPAGGLSIFTEYGVLRLDPFTKGGSCCSGTVFVATHHPGATTITSGTTDTFVGFQSPVSNTLNNLVKAGSAVPLKWQQFAFDSSGNLVPVLNLSLCTAFTVSSPNPPVCTTPSGVSTPWINVQAYKVPGATCAGDPGQTSLPQNFTGNSGLQNQGNGNYQYNWKTTGVAAGTCANIVFTYSSGAVIVTPPEFQFK